MTEALTAQAPQSKAQSGAKKPRRRKRGIAVLGGGADSQRPTALAEPGKARKGAHRWKLFAMLCWKCTLCLQPACVGGQDEECYLC